MFALQHEWRCDHCEKIVFSGKQFRSAAARCHLASVKGNGLCSKLCTADDDEAAKRQQYFQQLIAKLNVKKAATARKRKQRSQRLDASDAKIIAGEVVQKKKKKKSQPDLKSFLKLEASAAADVAVAKWAVAHDISPNAMKGPYWKRMNKALRTVPPKYSPMYDRKLFDEMLPKLKKSVDTEIKEHLKFRQRVGRTLTGDGATKGVPLINFLVHVPGKGVKLLDIIDCTEHLSEGGFKDAAYVAIIYYNILLLSLISHNPSLHKQICSSYDEEGHHSGRGG